MKPTCQQWFTYTITKSVPLRVWTRVNRLCALDFQHSPGNLSRLRATSWIAKDAIVSPLELASAGGTSDTLFQHTSGFKRGACFRLGNGQLQLGERKLLSQ